MITPNVIKDDCQLIRNMITTQTMNPARLNQVLQYQNLMDQLFSVEEVRNNTLNVGRHPKGLIRAAWKVQKLMRAQDARQKLEMRGAIAFNSPGRSELFVAGFAITGLYLSAGKPRTPGKSGCILDKARQLFRILQKSRLIRGRCGRCPELVLIWARKVSWSGPYSEWPPNIRHRSKDPKPT